MYPLSVRANGMRCIIRRMQWRSLIAGVIWVMNQLHCLLAASLSPGLRLLCAISTTNMVLWHLRSSRWSRFVLIDMQSNLVQLLKFRLKRKSKYARWLWHKRITVIKKFFFVQKVNILNLAVTTIRSANSSKFLEQILDAAYSPLSLFRYAYLQTVRLIHFKTLSGNLSTTCTLQQRRSVFPHITSIVN